MLLCIRQSCRTQFVSEQIRKYSVEVGQLEEELASSNKEHGGKYYIFISMNI